MPATPGYTRYNKANKSNLGGIITDLTPGVKNIEAAYGRAGATKHCTLGLASKLGSQEHGGNKTPYVRGQKASTDITEVSGSH